jgi:hypothetical protein
MKCQNLRTFALGSLLIGGCAATNGTRPTDMSAERHEQAAAAMEAQASSQGAEYNPNARATQTECDNLVLTPCWTSSKNPTSQHLADMQKFQRIAAEHRAAAQALRDAEGRACVGVSESDRDVSPFFHREDILRVELKPHAAPFVDTWGNKLPTAGAVITLRAVPGLTVEWLQRIVDCHIARNTALGYDVPEMSYCPLAVKGATATVQSARGAFDVVVVASDTTAIDEIVRRARALGHSG